MTAIVIYSSISTVNHRIQQLVGQQNAIQKGAPSCILPLGMAAAGSPTAALWTAIPAWRDPAARRLGRPVPASMGFGGTPNECFTSWKIPQNWMRNDENWGSPMTEETSMWLG